MVPCPEELLKQLIAQRARLMKILTSGVQEIEQPQLGRTQYRTLDEVQVALRYVDQQLTACGALPGGDPAAAMKVRRPIYPVVREV
jgi:hypothetical protein